MVDLAGSNFLVSVGHNLQSFFVLGQNIWHVYKVI